MNYNQRQLIQNGVEDRALVMELVEGETLAERLQRGPIPLVLNWAEELKAEVPTLKQLTTRQGGKGHVAGGKWWASKET